MIREASGRKYLTRQETSGVRSEAGWELATSNAGGTARSAMGDRRGFGRNV